MAIVMLAVIVFDDVRVRVMSAKVLYDPYFWLWRFAFDRSKQLKSTYG